MRSGGYATQPEWSRGRSPLMIAIAAVLFLAIFGLRLVVHDPGALVANFYAVPIALVAAEYGVRAGLAAGAVAVGFVFAWVGYLLRLVALPDSASGLAVAAVIVLLAVGSFAVPLVIK